MMNPMTLSVIGAAAISLLLGIAGANYQPAEKTEAAKTEVPAAEATQAPAAPAASAPAAPAAQ